MDPVTTYQIDVRETRTMDGRVVRDSRGRVLLQFRPFENELDRINATIDLGEGGATEAQARSLGMKPEDLRSTAEFELTEDHQIVRLINWQELGEQSMRVATAMFDAQVSAGHMDRKHTEQALSRLRTMTSTHDGVFGMYYKRIGPYLQGYGWQLNPEEVIEQETLFSVPFLNEPIDSTLKTYLDDDPETADVIEYKMTQVPNDEAMQRMLKALMASLDQAPDGDMEKEIDKMNFSIVIGWDYDVEQQAITKARLVRTTSIPQGSTMVEEWTWTLQSAP